MSLIYSEIQDQFAAMEKCAAYLDDNLTAIRELLLKTKPKSVVFMGCGSSFSLAKSMAGIRSICDLRRHPLRLPQATLQSMRSVIPIWPRMR